MKRLLTALLLTFACCACVAKPSAPGQSQATHAVTLDGHQFSIELATTPAQRAHGLMDRTHLAPNHGMLFVFAHEAPVTFWMKETLIPLDILFFNKERKLVSMQLNLPPCKSDPCPNYPSGKPAMYVLELAAGTAVRIGVNVGDTLTIKGRIGKVQ